MRACASTRRPWPGTCMAEREPAGKAGTGPAMSFRRVAMRLVHSATLYNGVQWLAGERQFSARLSTHLRVLAPGSTLIDIGGGTGLSRQGSAPRRYICLDLDPEKLRGFRARVASGLAIAADATACPFREASSDAVLCAKVVHHLGDAELGSMLAEAARILKPGGVLVLADAIRSRRLMSRLLWRLDRGSFPRSAQEIRRAIPAQFSVTGWEEFRVSMFHDFVLCTARRVMPAGVATPVPPGELAGGRT